MPGFTPAARGISVADVDGDGYPEMVFANFWEDSVYIKNQTSGNRFLGLHLLLPVAGSGEGMKIHDGHPTWREGTPAIGTFVEADVPDGRKSKSAKWTAATGIQDNGAPRSASVWATPPLL